MEFTKFYHSNFTFQHIEHINMTASNLVQEMKMHVMHVRLVTNHSNLEILKNNRVLHVYVQKQTEGLWQ